METRSITTLLTASALATIATTGCTALGPMPATTAVAPLAAGRPSLELQVGALPGYYLSSSVQREAKGAAISQAAIVVEPDSIVHVPGLVVGGRYVGDSSKGGYPEPMLGYRTFVDADKRFAVSAVGYGTHGSGSAKGASYAATRLDAAAAGFDDARLYAELVLPTTQRTLPVVQLDLPEASAPFEAWIRNPNRIPY